MALNLTDVVLLVLLLAVFVLGYFQGTIRQLLGIAAWLLSFLFAANLRDALGEFFSRYWTNLPPGYSAMIAFGILFFAFFIIANIIIQVLYRRTPIHSRLTFIDEVIGGLLGAALYLLVLATVIIILDSFYGRGSIGANDIKWMRDLHRVLLESNVGAWLQYSLIPGLIAILGVFLPQEVRDVAR
jgi:uncharacterized membrane protein required for colicin V production